MLANPYHDPIMIRIFYKFFNKTMQKSKSTRATITKNQLAKQMDDDKPFKMITPFAPSGDQPTAIQSLVDGVKAGKKDQLLLGVTGSGKTYTMAKVIESLGRPAIIMAHNKTLAAQLYGEFIFPS